jgi:predicted nucleic acid-binding protein
VIVYLDSSFLVRCYLPDEADHARALELLADPGIVRITGSWTRIEVIGALARAARARRADPDTIERVFLSDIAPDTGSVVVVDVAPAAIEAVAFDIVKGSGIRAMDAWHLACAQLACDALAEPGEKRGFATRDTQQAQVARELGFTIV